MKAKPILIGLLIVLFGAGAGLFYYYKPSLVKDFLQDAPFEGNIHIPELDELDVDKHPSLSEEHALNEGQKQRRMRELNERLRGEDQTRSKMDAVLMGIAQDESMLRSKLAQAQQRLEALRQERARGEDVDNAIEKALAAVQSHRNAIDEITKRKLALQTSREQAIQTQISLEEEIIKSGGSITIYDYDVWSPNYKRSDIMMFHDTLQDYTKKGL